MHIRKFCNCGSKLEREASDEATAKALVILWRRSHTSVDCAPTNEAGYRKSVSRIIARKARAK